MKTKISIGILVLSSIILLSLFNVNYPYSYKENILYNEKDVNDYSETESESSNLVNRNEAVKIATYFIEDILNNEIHNDDSKMYINLYQNDKNAESYYWNISWFGDDLSCSVEINTINRQINNIYVNKYPYELDSQNYAKYSSLNKDEILDMVSDLVYALNYDLKDYYLSVTDSNYNNEAYKICTFTNKKDEKDKFVICISINKRYIARYIRNPSKEIF